MRPHDCDLGFYALESALASVDLELAAKSGFDKGE
jgi:hypothetical protein